MHLGYTAVLRPTPTQMRLLSRVFGCARLVFNQHVAWREWEHNNGYSAKETRSTFSEIRSTLCTRNKKTVSPWLCDASIGALQAACRQAEDAYWAVVHKRAAGYSAKTPFRSKYGDQSFRLPGTNNFQLKMTDLRRHRGMLYVPKVGWVRFKASRNITAASSVTVRKTRSGSYSASFVVQEESRSRTKAHGNNVQPRVTGIDLGLSTLAACVHSDGTRELIANPRILKRVEAKLKRYDRVLSRKKKGSSNRVKARLRRAKQYQRIRNIRSFVVHQLTTTIANKSHVVVLEDLAVANMVKNRCLSKAIHDAAWAMIRSQLEYKTQLCGGQLVVIDRFARTTQTCSVCGSVGGPRGTAGLAVRYWQCVDCGSVLDRDFNAAVNIIDAGGLSESLNACGYDMRAQLAGR